MWKYSVHCSLAHSWHWSIQNSHHSSCHSPSLPRPFASFCLSPAAAAYGYRKWGVQQGLPGEMELPAQPRGEAGCSHMEVMGNCSGQGQGAAAGATCRGWRLLGQGGQGRRAVPGEVWALCDRVWSCLLRQGTACSWTGGGGRVKGSGKQIQLTAPEAAQLGSASSHNSRKQVKRISNEQNSSVRNIMLINTTDYLFQQSAFTQMVLYLPDIISSELLLFHGLLMKNLAMIIYTKDEFIIPGEKCSSLHNLQMPLSKDLFYSNISWRISFLLVIFPRH